MNAIEAKKITRQAQVKFGSYKNIKKDIEERSRRGVGSVWVSYMSKQTYKKLKEEGYIISYSGDRYEVYWY